MAALLLPFAILAGCHSSPKASPGHTPTASATVGVSPSALVTASPSLIPSPSLGTATAPSPTATATPLRSPSPSPTAAGTASPGPYTTIQSAESYANGQTGAPFTFSAAYWQAGDTLQVLHGTPSQSANYGGDYYFFFVNGHAVGAHNFAQAMATLTTPTGLQVTFSAYKPGDPVCCPSGGQSTVQFTWNGTSLATVGSLAGANLS